MSNMSSSSISGLDYFIQGLKFLKKPALIPFVIIPLVVNILVYTLLIWLAYKQFSGWVDHALVRIPEIFSVLGIILWPLFGIVIGLAVFFTFSILANLIAAPFNSFLSERVLHDLSPESLPQESSFTYIFRMIPASIKREFSKMFYYSSRIFILGMLTFIPVVNIITPFLWVMFAAWIMSVQYIDYPADNQDISFMILRKKLKKVPKSILLSFGATVSLFALIPIVNLLVMPAAVVGATLLWIDVNKSFDLNIESDSKIYNVNKHAASGNH